MRASIRAIAIVVLPCVAFNCGANEFTVVPDLSGGFNHYRWNIGIDGAGGAGNPPLYLARGMSYTFSIDTSSIHPFWIKTVQGAGSLNGYDGGGLSANPTSAPATVTFEVPSDAPDTLFYNCGNHAEMTGPIHIVVFRNGFD